MTRLFMAMALALICVPVATASVARNVTSACPSQAEWISGTPSNVRSLIQAVTRTVPRVYSSMTNQAGRGAWRGYVIREVVSLDKTYPATPERNRLRAAAAARCGAQTAAAAWAVRLGFPNAQSIPSSYSTVYFVYTRSGWRFWFRLP